MLNLLLDQATRTCLGRRAFGLQSAQVQLGLDDAALDERQTEVLTPILEDLVAGRSAAEVLGLLRGAALILGARRRPNRLPRNGETLRQSEVEALRRRLGRRDLLSQGLRELEPEHCVLYVALTRARRMCGWLGGVEQLEPDVDDVADASSV